MQTMFSNYIKVEYIYNLYPKRKQKNRFNAEHYIHLQYLCPSFFTLRDHAIISLARMADKAKDKVKKIHKKMSHNYTHWLRSIQYLEGSAE